MTRKINIADSSTSGTWMNQCSVCPNICDDFSCFLAPIGYHQLKNAIWKHHMRSVLCGVPVPVVLVIWLENWWMLFLLNELFPPWPTWVWTWYWVGLSSSELLFVWSIGESQLNFLRWSQTGGSSVIACFSLCVPLFLHYLWFCVRYWFNIVIVQLSFIVHSRRTHVLCYLAACDNLDNNCVQLNIIVAVIEIMPCSENW